MKLTLRKCTQNDIDIMYKIANDPTVRENAFNTAPIIYENHVKWYKDSMDNAKRKMYIAEDSGTIVGQIRLDIQKDKSVISYAIEKENRNKGYGSEVLKLIKIEAMKNNISMLEGLVKKNNIASIKAFRKNKFIEFEEKDYYKYIYLLRGGDRNEFDKNR